MYVYVFYIQVKFLGKKTKRHLISEKNKKVLSQILVKLGFVFLLLFFISFSPAFYDIGNKTFSLDIDRESGLILAVLSLIFIVNIIWYLRKRDDSEKLNNALSDYVDKEIAKAILSKKSDVNFSGEKKKISVFFSDIEWFTSLSNKFQPEELVLFLKEYFSIMSANIQKYNWYIDKYEWDCVMALWWAFHGMQKDSYDTCLSALKQQKALRILNIKFKKTLGQEIRVRMGINTWEAVLGNIGARGKKVEFTAFWDCVNVASRLEWANKLYGTNICVSEKIYNECFDFFEFREIDTVVLRWKDTWIRIYELLDELWKVSKEKMKIYTRYEKALHLYYNREYQKAFNIFTQLKNKDIPSKVMALRCEKFLKKAPLKNWDSAWRMDIK